MRLFRSLVILAVGQSVRTLTALYRGRFNRCTAVLVGVTFPGLVVTHNVYCLLCHICLKSKFYITSRDEHSSTIQKIISLSSKIARFAKTQNFDQNKRITGGHSKTVILNISIACKGDINQIITTDYPVRQPPVFNVLEIIFSIVMIFFQKS